MQIEEHQVDEIVRRVLRQMDQERVPQAELGVFANAEDALKAVQAAQARFNRVSIAQRKAMIQAMRETAIEHSQDLAQLAAEESKMGRVSDKVVKNLLVAEKTPGVEDLPSAAHIGDTGLTVEEFAPFGTILAITPVTNPTATVINNAISMIAAGNTIFFAPHPSGVRSSLATLTLLNEAIERVGGPPNLMVATQEAKLEVVRDLMTHPKISLICATGGAGVVDLALRSGKRAIGAAAGNPPVVVDNTANPEKAARDIISGGAFDKYALYFRKRDYCHGRYGRCPIGLF